MSNPTSVIMASIASRVVKMTRIASKATVNIRELRGLAYESAADVAELSKRPWEEVSEHIGRGYRGSDRYDRWLADQFKPYAQFDGNWKLALRAVAEKATKTSFVNEPMRAAFPNGVPAPKTRTAKARLDILDAEDAEKTLADPKQRPVAFIAHDHDDEPRVTPTKQERAYDTQKELEQELARAYATIAAMKKTEAAKDQLIAAQADEITALRAKLKGRAA